ncbi:MAG TPA: ABC transporter permease [Chloroflexota bacterium]|nr:ABC transporter permease [Chloroflexota bacterium]
MTALALRRPRARFGTRWRVPPLIALSIAFVTIVILAALVGRLLFPGSISDTDPLSIGVTPTADHWLGTDELGRDVFRRVIAGAQPALVGPVIIAVSGFLISGLVGIGTGYIGGLLDTVTMRIVDFFFALPGLLIAIVVVTVVQGGYWIAVAVLCLLNVQGDIRLVRSGALGQRNLPYVEALRLAGVPGWRIMYVHIGRNILPILLADFAVDFGSNLVALAGLAFLGLGSQPGTADWGLMLTEGQRVLFANPWAALAPGLAIVLLATSVNLIGDWIYERYTQASVRR